MELSADESFLSGIQMAHGIMQIFVTTCVVVCLKISL